MSHNEKIEHLRNYASHTVGHSNTTENSFFSGFRDFAIGIIDERLKLILSQHLEDSTKNATTKEEEYLTREETCRLLHIKRTTLWKYTKKGLLKSYRIGRPILYSRQEVISKLTLLKKYSRVN